MANDNRRIYRASVSLGTPIDAVLQPITRTNSPENNIDFCPYDLDIDIGPVVISSLSCYTPAFVGWIGVMLSGSGYLFPWTFRDAVKRLEGTPEIQRLTELCRSFWPVPAGQPEEHIVDMRKQIGESGRTTKSKSHGTGIGVFQKPVDVHSIIRPLYQSVVSVTFLPHGMDDKMTDGRSSFT